MSKITDERLDELVAKHQDHHDYAVKILPHPVEWEQKVIQELADWLSALRELRDYRKAVREYVEAVDAKKVSDADSHPDLLIPDDVVEQAEATLRALQERT